MWCRECGGEYRAGIVMCPTCELALVESLEPDPGAPVPASAGAADSRPGLSGQAIFVDLAPFGTIEEARTARVRLRDKNIPSQIIIRDGESDEEECWIVVPETSYQAAFGLLETHEPLSDDRCNTCQGPFDADGTCPTCVG
jgi:hypothetical protein